MIAGPRRRDAQNVVLLGAVGLGWLLVATGTVLLAIAGRSIVLNLVGLVGLAAWWVYLYRRA
jgi:hypothetical protein